MLAIRLQRLGRKGYPVYRLIVQESQRHPSSGRIVAQVGSYNPHTKEVNLEIDDIQKYLDNGAQPSDRVVRLLKAEKKIKLPKWVKLERTHQERKIRNPEKLRRNQPKEAEAPAEEAAEAPVETEAKEAEAPAEEAK